MRKNGAAAVAYMAALAHANAAGVAGYCLKTCRLAWGLPADETSAIKEWQSIPAKYRHTDPMKAPVGAPHFWSVGKYGHVALQAEHEGFIWTTDLPKNDHIGLVHIDTPARRWRAKYLGWSSQFQNKTLPLGLEAPKEAA